MSYINENKKAWENAFDQRSGTYSDDLAKKLLEKENPFFHEDFLNVINAYDFTGKTIGQYCTNNGRELLQLSKRGVHQAVGFDLAKNMVDYANTIAKNLKLPAQFVESDILQIDASYNNYFDFGLITVGAICWFEDLKLFFKKVSEALKPGASLFIHEIHPFQLMLATSSESNYIPTHPKTPVNNYFENKVWKEHGMGYMTDKKGIENTFTSFSHTLSDIFNALIANGFEIELFKEFDYCVGNLFNALDSKGIPLSMILVAKKHT